MMLQIYFLLSQSQYQALWLMDVDNITNELSRSNPWGNWGTKMWSYLVVMGKVLLIPKPSSQYGQKCINSVLVFYRYCDRSMSLKTPIGKYFLELRKIQCWVCEKLGVYNYSSQIHIHSPTLVCFLSCVSFISSLLAINIHLSLVWIITRLHFLSNSLSL